MRGTKYSFGVICFNNGLDGPEMLMIKRSTTYHFCDFVAGRYKRRDDDHVIKLFNNMTYHEKMDILNMKFQNMWYRIYMYDPEQVPYVNNSAWANAYYKKKNKFEKTFCADYGKKLHRLIRNSVNAETPWEFPKGRKNNRCERDMETAIREFSEETGLESDKYEMMWDVPPYVETYTDFGVTYQNIYYFANILVDFDPIKKFYNKKQIHEVSAVKWVSRQNIKYMNLEKKTLARMEKRFNKIVKKYKKVKKYKCLSRNIKSGKKICYFDEEEEKRTW